MVIYFLTIPTTKYNKPTNQFRQKLVLHKNPRFTLISFLLIILINTENVSFLLPTIATRSNFQLQTTFSVKN